MHIHALDCLIRAGMPMQKKSVRLLGVKVLGLSRCSCLRQNKKKPSLKSLNLPGKFKSIPRTEGVSTTDIVGRILLMNTRCGGHATHR